MRFTLAAFAAQGREIRLDEDRIEGYRHFINKIWNSARFALMHVSDCNESIRKVTEKPVELALVHRWILSRTATTIEAVRLALDEYRFNDVASATYQFVWREFCDWYLEWIKADLFSKDEQAKQQARGVLLTVLETILKLIHPITPFVTEEIWSVLPGEREILATSSFPEPQKEWLDDRAVHQMDLLMGVITGLRNIRSEAEVHPSMKVDAVVVCVDEETRSLISSFSAAISDMTRLGSLAVQAHGEKPADAATYIFQDIEIYVPLKGLVDVVAELDKLQKERKKVEAKLQQVNGKLSNNQFLSNAPEDVIKKEHEKKAALDATIAKIVEAEERLKKL
jgi:valyl-tRNA synthetase